MIVGPKTRIVCGDSRLETRKNTYERVRVHEFDVVRWTMHDWSVTRILSRYTLHMWYMCRSRFNGCARVSLLIAHVIIIINRMTLTAAD